MTILLFCNNIWQLVAYLQNSYQGIHCHYLYY